MPESGGGFAGGDAGSELNPDVDPIVELLAPFVRNRSVLPSYHSISWPLVLGTSWRLPIALFGMQWTDLPDCLDEARKAILLASQPLIPGSGREPELEILGSRG